MPDAHEIAKFVKEKVALGAPVYVINEDCPEDGNTK